MLCLNSSSGKTDPNCEPRLLAPVGLVMRGHQVGRRLLSSNHSCLRFGNFCNDLYLFDKKRLLNDSEQGGNSYKPVSMPRELTVQETYVRMSHALIYVSIAMHKTYYICSHLRNNHNAECLLPNGHYETSFCRSTGMDMEN